MNCAEQVCDRLIAAAEKDGGYDFGYDSLDGKPAVQIDIIENEQVARLHHQRQTVDISVPRYNFLHCTRSSSLIW
jgi:hypothetical protein